MESISTSFSINSNAKVLYIKPADDLGEFQQHVEALIQLPKTVLKFAFLNPGVAVDFELLLSDYDEGSLSLDCSGPGIELRRRESNKWDISTSVFKNIGLSLAGVRYDPSAASLFEIAAELKALRRNLQQK